MWVSKKQLDALTKRLDDLEERQGIASADEGGHLYATRYSYYSRQIPINSIVLALARKAGLRYVREKPGHFEYETDAAGESDK